MIWNYVKVLSNVGLSLCNCLGSRICAGVNSGYKAIASLCYLRTGSPLIYLGANNNKEVNFVNKTDKPFVVVNIRFLYKGIIIKHNKTEPTYTKTSLFLCEKRRFFMARTEKGGKVFLVSQAGRSGFFHFKTRRIANGR